MRRHFRIIGCLALLFVVFGCATKIVSHTRDTARQAANDFYRTRYADVPGGPVFSRETKTDWVYIIQSGIPIRVLGWLYIDKADGAVRFEPL